MALKKIDAQCDHCSKTFTAKPKQSFLGFQKVRCPSCNKKTQYALTSGYRFIYWVILVLMVVAIAKTISEGNIGFPGGIGIAIIFALVRDASIRKKQHC